MKNTDLSPSAIAAYVGLVMTSMTGYEKNYTTVRNVYYRLYEKVDFPTNKISDLAKGIQELINKTDLGIKPSKYKNEYIYTTNQLRANVKNGHFINIDTEDIRQIYKISFRMKDNILRYYLFILSTILINKEVYLSESDKKFGCIGCMYQRVIRDKLKISQPTQLTYNDILQNDLKLLYITDYELTYRKKDGTFGSAPSIYGRYEDRNYVDAYVKQKYPQAVEAHKKAIRSYHRSMIMKYNAICKGKQYEKKIVREVEDYVTKYNEQIYQLIQSFENNGQKSQADNERKKIKDLTVFKKYLYK